MSLRLVTSLSFSGIFLLTISSAWAGPERRFVSGAGDDANPCSLAEPCRDFSAALAAVDPDGEVVVLDSAEYEPFTVTQGVTITVPAGLYAGINASGGDAVTVAADPADVVVLRGLTLNGMGGTRGIHFVNGGELYVENTSIAGFSEHGISIVLTNSAQLFVMDTEVRDCNGSGVSIWSSDGTASVAIEESRFEGNSSCGVRVGRGGSASIRDSVASGNAYGFCSVAFDDDESRLNVQDVLAANNTIGGISCAGTPESTVHVSQSTVTNNGTGFVQSSGCTFNSQGNNLVGGNGINISGAITTIPGQ